MPRLSLLLKLFLDYGLTTRKKLPPAPIGTVAGLVAPATTVQTVFLPKSAGADSSRPPAGAQVMTKLLPDILADKVAGLLGADSLTVVRDL